MRKYTLLSLIILMNFVHLPLMHSTVFRYYGFEDGLSHRNVLSINQDAFGFLWMGTISGLDRFDGYEFDRFSYSILNDRYDTQSIRFIEKGGDGELILGLTNRLIKIDAQGKVLSTYDFGKKEFTRGEERKMRSLVKVDDHFWGIVRDEKDNSYFIVQLDNELNAQYKWDLGIANTYTDLSYEDGKLYFIKDERYLHSFDIREKKIEQDYPIEVQHLITVEDQLTLVSPSFEYYFLKDFSPVGSLLNYPKPDQSLVYKKILYKDGVLIWMADLQVFSFNPADGFIEEWSTEINKMIGFEVHFQDLFVDKANSYWLATDFGAVCVSLEDKRFDSVFSGGDRSCSSDLCSMRGISSDGNGTIYFSYYNSIASFDVSSGRLKRLPLSKNLIDDPYGLVYFKDRLHTGSGLVYDPHSGRRSNRLDLKGEGVLDTLNADSLYLFNEGNIFLWDSQGLSYKLMLKNKEIEISYALNMGNQYFILGTKSNGLYEYYPRKNELMPVDLDSIIPNLSTLRINVLKVSESGAMWIGTAKGVYVLDAERKHVEHLNVANGRLDNDFINGILEESDKYMWISTDKGLVCIFQPSLEPLDLDDEDLPFSEFNRISFYKYSSDRLIFGGLNGLISFDPEDLRATKEDSFSTAVMISDFKKYNGREDSLEHLTAPFASEDTIVLEYYDAFFEVDYALAHFEDPLNNRFKYKLEGYDKEWVEAGKLNSVRYSYVPAGTYKLLFKGITANGKEETSAFGLNILIKEAFYLRPWFIITCSLFTIGVIYLVTWLRIRALRKRADELEHKVELRTHELKREKQKSEDLLLNILPAEIADELKENGKIKAKKHQEVSVLFTDFKGFTKIASSADPEDLVDEIDHCFRNFDHITTRHKLEKIKTIGDAYLCVGGIDSENSCQTADVIRAALEIQQFMEQRSQERKRLGQFAFEIRLGVHTGPLVAGIVGIKKFAFDIWGDTVNIASHLESNSEIGKVNISQQTYELINHQFECEYRGKISMKNKGMIDMYFVTSAKDDSLIIHEVNEDDVDSLV